MAIDELKRQPQKHSRARALRPLVWWFLLVLVLFGIRTHERLMADTQLHFSVSLEGRSVFPEPEVRLDGDPVRNGALLSLGKHRLVMTHPQGVAFSTNFFAWYGGIKVGDINLKRAKGTLAVSIEPPASRLLISGSEFSRNLTNSSGLSIEVPTGDYTIYARYRHLETKESIFLGEGALKSVRITPKLGAVRLAAIPEGVSFRVLNATDQVIETGSFPGFISELPEGAYTVIATHKSGRREQSVDVKASKTNDVLVEFKYGAAFFNTTPPGAMVTMNEGKVLGITPLLISEIEPGRKTFSLRLEDFEPAALSVEIDDGKTNSFTRKLVRQAYARAMREATNALSNASYDRAIDSLEAALRVEPADVLASQMLIDAKIARSFTRVEEFGKSQNYALALIELKSILAASPGNEKAIRLLSEFQKLALVKADEEKASRLRWGKTLFKSASEKTPDAALFETQELSSKKSVRDVETAVIRALAANPAFKITGQNSALTEAFEIIAEQEFMTVLQTSAGKRKCLIVGARVYDEETQVLFKVLEYKVEAVNKLSIGNLIKMPVAVTYIPITPLPNAPADDKFQTRLREGVLDLKTRISRAIAE